MTAETIGFILGIGIKLGLVIWAMKRGWGKWPWLLWLGSEAFGFIIVVAAATFATPENINTLMQTTGLISFCVGALVTIAIIVMICKPRNRTIKFVNE